MDTPRIKSTVKPSWSKWFNNILEKINDLEWEYFPDSDTDTD